MVWLAVGLGSFIGGMVQTVTGFGSGVVLILILSRFFEITVASSLNTSICMVLSATLAWQFRHEIQWKLVMVPILPYMAASILAIRTMGSMDMTVLAVLFALFLMTLSVFFLFFEQRVRLNGSVPTALACGGISGVFSGLFGVGGPLMALHFISVAPGHIAYVSTLQFFFLPTNVVSLLTRVSSGFYTADLIPITVLGVVCILSGKWAGLRIASRINGEKLKKLIYIFVGISGAVTLLQQIL